MNVLMAGLDDSVLEEGSDTRLRHEAYADLLSEKEPGSRLFVLCYSDERSDTITVGDSLVISGSGSLRRETFGAAILREGKQINSAQGLDLIVTQTPIDDGLAGSVLGQITDTPVMVQHHSPFFDDTLWKKDQPLWPVKRLLFEVTKRRVDAVRVVSRAAVDWYRENGVDRSALYHNPVSVHLPESVTEVTLPATRNVLFVGRLIPRKGLETLLTAFAEIETQVGDVALQIVGTGPETHVTELRERARTLGVDEAVTLTGYLSEEELAGYYEACDVTVMTSRLEPYGRVAVESLAFGTPVVSTATVGARDIISDGDWGYVVPKEDHGTVAERTVELLDDPDVRETMGALGRSYARSEHDPEKLRADWVDIWRAVATGETAIRSPTDEPFTPPEAYTP